MYLTKFMNENPDWQAKLAVAPYFLEIRSDIIEDVEYYILKYNMIMSDMSLPEVQEARGSIFRKNEDGYWVCVCHPFDKFFNYGEPQSEVGRIDLERLDRDYTYMFELTSPYNRIVIRYEGVNLWYLGRRNILNQEEDSEGLRLEGLLYPKVYPHHSLADCIAAAHQMGDDEEGYVVCDANFNRIKIIL